MFIDEFYINVLLGFFSALLLAGGLFWWFYQRLWYASRVLEKKLYLREQELHKLSLTLRTYKERITQLSSNKETMRQEFENIAHGILNQNTQALNRQNSQDLHQILNPFKENIKAFHDRLENYYGAESKERYSLTKEIQNLQALNLQISEDALNLTRALKGDNKVQGDWGEMILERVLESSGLKKDREYSIQKSYLGDKGERFRPDVVIHLPENREVIIDSKVSLKSYENYYTDSENSEKHLATFIASINAHIKSLSTKSYQKLEGVNSLDFVLLFIPIEGAFLLASQKDRTLFSRAYQHNIIVVSPSTLLAVLRVIENAWRFEYQNKNAQVIAKKAGDLYDKFAGFVAQMQKIDSSLHKAQEAYDDAFKKLSTGKGNLMHRVDELKALEGVSSSKEQKNG